jgi:hypothetical protein
MPLSPDEATRTLKDIAQTERRSASAYGNHVSSPHLIMWGLIWMAMYGGFYLYPRYPQIFWALSLAGIAGSFLIGARYKNASSIQYRSRFALTFVAIFAFITAFFAIFQPFHGMQAAAFFPLLVALAYALSGIWTPNTRIGVVGVAIGVLTVVGYFYLQEYYLLWLAFVGGGALILGGLWMRSVV